MTGLVIAFFVIVALEIIAALVLYEWDGVYVLIGILAGIGFWIADELRKKTKERRSRK